MKILILVAFACVGAYAQSCPTYTAPSGGSYVNVVDTLYSSDGQLAQGTITLQWATFTSADTHVNQAACFQYPVQNGVVNIKLEPNAGASPTGTYYIAQYAIQGGPTRYQEVWVIPSSGPVNLAAIRTAPTPTVSYVLTCAQLPAFIGDVTSAGSTCTLVAGAYIVKNNQANTYTTGLQDMSAAAFKPPLSTVSTLPAASSATNRVYEVTDGASASDCVSGSGAYRVWCVSNGSTWSAMGGSGGGGGGATTASGLTDLLPVRTSSTVLTVGANCATAGPCNVAVNGVTHAFTNSFTITNSASSALTIRAYISDGSDSQTAGTFIVANSYSSGVACSSGCTVVNSVSSFPASPGIVQEFTWTATGTAGQWDSAGYTDDRSAYGGGTYLLSGNGNCTITYASTGTTITCTGSSSISAGTYYLNSGYAGTTDTASANATSCSGFVVPPGGLSVGHVAVYVATADGSHNSDIGVYNAAGTLVAHTGATAFGSTGQVTTAFSGGTQTIPAGKTYFCITSTANTLALQANYQGTSFFQGAVSGASTTGGALLSSLTPPADSPSVSGSAEFAFVLFP